jgi:quinol monooxygenase YgiN
MSEHVFVVSEWLAKENHEQNLLKLFKNLMATTAKQESGCIRAHATRQISHPGSPGKSKYTIILLQEYTNVQAFDLHCKAAYVTDFFKTYVDNKKTGIVEDWRCRLFSEEA